MRKENYRISFGGYNGFQYVDDVAKIFIQAARTPKQGADVFNLAGSVAQMSEVVAAIQAVLPAAQVTHEETPLPFPHGATDAELHDLLGEIPYTPLEEGVAKTMAHFESAIANGLLPKNS